MTRSYKLLSIYLDQKELPSYKPPIIDYSITKALQDVAEPYNLLDLIYEQKTDTGDESCVHFFMHSPLCIG